MNILFALLVLVAVLMFSPMIVSFVGFLLNVWVRRVRRGQL